MRPRRLLRLSLFFFGYLALSFVAGVFVAEGTLHPHSALTICQRRAASPRNGSRPLPRAGNVAIPARDGATLRTWSIRPRNSNGKAVILLHGLSDNRLGMIGYAELLLSHGFSVVM